MVDRTRYDNHLSQNKPFSDLANRESFGNRQSLELVIPSVL
jgi:hypothetical protein